ncbi:sensor histidine kinase [Paenibacillus sp. OK003]|uniref:sensor histidine kinase n=1 Tax=Paenibacillus sp. OK003 TaxID=1884380 RepID=UPI0008CA87EF|nr:two-component system, sensor histidine kinase YesM [Paenibacillus sp. OK003]
MKLNFFNNIRLRDKMLILYLFFVLVPVILTNVIFYQVTIANVKSQRMADLSKGMEQIRSQFMGEIRNAADFSSSFYTDSILNDMLDVNYTNPVQYIEAYDSYLRKILNTYYSGYRSLQGLTIYVDNESVLPSGGVEFLTEEVRQSEPYRLLANSEHSAPLLMRSGPEGNRQTFSILRKLNYYEALPGWKEKFVRLDLKPSTIRQIFTNLNVQGNLYLINPAGQIDYSTDSGIPWSSQLVNYSDVMDQQSKKEFEMAFPLSGEMKGWKINGVFNESEIYKELGKPSPLVVVLACINLILPTWIIIWMTRTIHVRLARILKHMEKVKHQRFEPIRQPESSDEIGQLTAEFNRMTMTIHRLINDVYVADIQHKNLELQRRHAQLNALQSQINPHFLFNALETIRMRSLMKDEDETARIIYHMAKIFRNALTWNRDKVSIQEELEYVTCFLEIQQYRFGHKLNYTIDLDPEAADCSIPKMTLLPFVENASIHGIEPLKEGGEIRLRIRRTGSELICVVEDSGAGMTEDKRNLLLSYVETEDAMGDRVGVQNVIYRLKLIYDSRFHIQIDSALRAGTRVEIGLPLEDSANPPKH